MVSVMFHQEALREKEEVSPMMKTCQKYQSAEQSTSHQRSRTKNQTHSKTMLSQFSLLQSFCCDFEW